MEQLSGKRIAMMATDGFEEVELVGPKELLERAGAEVVVVALAEGKIKGWNDDDWGESVRVDATVDTVKSQDFDAIVIPGGVINADKLRMNERAVKLVWEFYEQGKVIASICHGPWMLVETGIANGHTIASWPSLQTDIRNAGGAWVNQEVVADEGIVTSRKPDDIPAFTARIIEEMLEPRHDTRSGRRRTEKAGKAELI